MAALKAMTRAVCAVGVLILGAGGALAGSISASASGSSSPTITYTSASTKTMTNGDFIIGTLNGAPSPLGDGEDDWTTWILDFTADPGYASFPTSATLASAVLTLTLTPKDGWIKSDQVWMDSLAAIDNSAIQSLTVAGGTKTVTLNLLDDYTSSSILDVLTSTKGLVPMTYQDDAIVSYARLDLTSTVPLPPAALAGWCLLAALAATRTLGRAAKR